MKLLGDFGRVLAFPRPVLIGMVLQFSIMPVMGWTVAALFTSNVSVRRPRSSPMDEFDVAKLSEQSRVSYRIFEFLQERESGHGGR